MAGAVSVATSGAVIGDLHVETLRRIEKPDTRPRRPGVLERVRQRLLDDAVGGEVDSGGKLDGIALHGELDGETGRPHLLQEPVQV
jgi:hypothetical protein